MPRFRDLWLKITLLVLGLTSLLQAQETPNFHTDGPQICPPLNQFLSPTLLDVLIYPGLTFAT